MDEEELRLHRMIRSTLPNSFTESGDEFLSKGKLGSYADHGLSWVERLIQIHIPKAELIAPLHASLLYGGFFEEFDRWRSARQMDELQSFQGAVIQSNGLNASCMQLARRDGIVGWYGKEYKGSVVSLFCIDRMLIDSAHFSLYDLLLSPGHSPAQAFQYWVDCSEVKATPLSEYEMNALAAARAAFEQSTQALIDYDHDFGSREFLTGIRSQRNDKDFSEQFSRYAQSACFHFISGHEFGHYCFSNGKSSSFDKMRAFVLQRPDCVENGDLFEEMFCDVVALEDCLFQRDWFSIPLNITVFGTLWVLHLVSSIIQETTCAESDNKYLLAGLQARIQGICEYWTLRPGLRDYKLFGEIAAAGCPSRCSEDCESSAASN